MNLQLYMGLQQAASAKEEGGKEGISGLEKWERMTED
jgi:hypothetical protein